MTTALPLQSPPKRLCILRLSALGDVTHVLPVVRAIQKQWPETELTWVCGEFESRLLENLQGVRLIRFNKKNGWRAYVELRQRLKATRFDVLLHMQVSARSNLASLMIKARIRLGWDHDRSRDLHGFCVNHRVPAVRQQHQVAAFLSFAQALGVDVDQPEWGFPIAADEQDFVNSYLDRGSKTLIISPSSSHSLRNWTVEGYAAIADYAVTQHGFKVLLCGGPSEREISFAKQIDHQVTSRVTNLTGKDTLQQLVALIDASDAVISPDSGPLHLANALGKPVIGLYACTWSRRSGPYNSLGYCVDHFAEAAEQYLRQDAESLRWGTRIEQPGVMGLVKLDEVKRKLDLLVQNELR